MAEVVAALTPPAVSTIVTVTPSRASDLQARLDIAGGVDRLDDRRGIGAAALPVRYGALRIGLDQADIVAGLNGGKREADGKRALSRTALLGGQYDRLHFESFGGAFSGTGVTPYKKLAFCGGEP